MQRCKHGAAAWLTLPCRLCALHVHVCRHLAASEGAYQVTEWLLTHHVDVNALDRFRRTPLEVHMGAALRWAGLGCHGGTTRGQPTPPGACLPGQRCWPALVPACVKAACLAELTRAVAACVLPACMPAHF